MTGRFIGIFLMGAVAGLGMTARAAVSVTETATAYVLDNGVLKAQIEKRSGDVTSLVYKGIDFLQSIGEGKKGAYWSLPGTTLQFGTLTTAEVTEDPATNGGKRATITMHHPYDGKDNTAAADVDIVYSLADGDSGLFAMTTWEHKPAYPLLTFGPGRFAAKLNGVFDYLAIDAHRQRLMPSPADWGAGTVLNMKEARRLTTGIHTGEVEHKYDYAAVQFDTPAYGWASTTAKVGCWMVTPSNEYMSGGPTKVELNAHLDGNQQGYATLLNVWKGPHYGGTTVSIPQGQSWTKVIGPFELYCNTTEAGAGTDGKGVTSALFTDALERAKKDAGAWPFDWVHVGAAYPAKAERATVSGKIALLDAFTRPSQMSHLLVGLAHADYAAGRGAPIDWQHDGEYYQYWVRGEADGAFVIPNVRAGSYTLHAFADGVLGEYAQANVTVTAGKALDLGTITWTPVRYGKPLWEIGTPDRTVDEFRGGENAHTWGLYVKYPEAFPKDVDFTIGKSDPKKDWYLMQVPRGSDPTGKGRGEATTWRVRFDLPGAVKGKASLRLAMAGTEARSLALAMNGKPIGTLTNLPNTMLIHRDSDRSAWAEYTAQFDAATMQAGENVLTLTVPAGSMTAGVGYDYLRLELDENAAAPASPVILGLPAAGAAGPAGGDE